MSFSKLLANVRHYDENASVIFDCDEPIGRPTDLVMPRQRWFGRGKPVTATPSSQKVSAAPSPPRSNRATGASQLPNES